MDPLPLHNVNPSHLNCTLRSRTVILPDRDDLQTHFLEAFPNTASDPASLPLILLLHGFPELAYSWRKVLAPLAAARGGYHVVAPDLRGYGRTIMKRDNTAAQIQYDEPIEPFHFLMLADDARSLVNALGHRSVALLVGHDFGSLIAGHCVYAHPALFQSLVFMSAQFVGLQIVDAPPSSNKDAADNTTPGSLMTPLGMALAKLDPPRKHYVEHHSAREANRVFCGADKKDLYTFFGKYYYMNSGAWEGNTAHPLPCASNPFAQMYEIARDLGTLPEYYILPLNENMRQVVDRHAGQDPRYTWPADDAEAGWVYATEFTRTGFQGALNWYRVVITIPGPEVTKRLAMLNKRKPSIPTGFIGGTRDWAVFQRPDGLSAMTDLFGVASEDIVFIEGAGHWVQQEKPDETVAELLRFLGKVEHQATVRP